MTTAPLRALGRPMSNEPVSPPPSPAAPRSFDSWNADLNASPWRSASSAAPRVAPTSACQRAACGNLFLSFVHSPDDWRAPHAAKSAIDSAECREEEEGEEEDEEEAPPPPPLPSSAGASSPTSLVRRARKASRDSSAASSPGPFLSCEAAKSTNESVLTESATDPDPPRGG